MRIQYDQRTGALKVEADPAPTQPVKPSRARVAGRPSSPGVRIKCPLCGEVNEAGTVSIPAINFTLQVCVLCVGAWQRVSKLADLALRQALNIFGR